MIDFTQVVTAEDKLENAAKAKFKAIQAGQVKAKAGGIVVNGILFDSDLSARMAYNELALRFSQNPTFSTRWKASTGSWVTMDAVLFSQVMAAGEAHIQGCFAWQEEREQEAAAALAAKDLEALEAVSEVFSPTI